MFSGRKISWLKQSNTQWQTRAHRGYTGTIDLGSGANPYQLTITPGPVVTSHPNYAAAKNEFRKFLRTKPVNG